MSMKDYFTDDYFYLKNEGIDRGSINNVLLFYLN